MAITRRTVVAGAAAGALVPHLARAAGADDGIGATAPAKVLRYAFEVAETSFDPAKINDLYSRTLTPHIFEGLYTYDHLARPVKIKPLTADGMAQHSDDFRVWTARVRPGIYFAADPAFKGQRRELVAQDYVYSWKRFADPANKSPVWSGMETEGYLGLPELRQRALGQKKPFDYDKEIEGIRAVDRYTIRFTLKEPRPRFDQTMAGGDLYGAVAREVVEFYGAEAEAHPVGTGPFKLVQWRRSSFLALERNLGFREMLYDAEPAADDAEGQALLARFKGRRLPMVDRVEISIIEEEQPRWLSFVNGEADVAYRVGYQFAPQAMPNGKVAPNLAKKGIKGFPVVESASNYYLFNMDDPVIGGYSPAQVALRRAISLGIDSKKIIDYAYNGLGTVAQGPTLPNTTAYDPKLKTEFSDFDPARARALLDLFGFVDRNGDGWRERPDGSPLVLRVSTQAQLRDRKIAEVLNKGMKVLGIRIELAVAQWPENLKAARAGNYQVWSVGGSSAAPDSEGGFQRFDSRQIGGQNMGRVRLPALDRLYDRIQTLPDGPERLAVFREAERIAIAYMPYKFVLNRVSLDMTQKRVIGYRRPVFWQDWWQYVDIDDGAGAGAKKASA
ncbi:MAG TPA: ABC transporter substrate-binding protein [Caldimonas sp.]|jgi:ABC-type transport system substrate-binding protein|nr:ABC transporter substrate-binding protein [Caldimonas sp.]